MPNDFKAVGPRWRVGLTSPWAFTMFVAVDCSQCRKPFQVPEAALGKATICPWCQASVLALPLSGLQAANFPPAPTANAGVDKSTSAEANQQLRPLPGSPDSPASTQVLSLDDPVQPEQPSLVESKASGPRRGFGRGALLMLTLVGLLLGCATAAITIAVLRFKQGYLVSMELRPFAAPDGSCGIELLGQATEEDSDPERGERRYVSTGWYSGTTAWLGWRNLTPAQVLEASSDKGWIALRKEIFDPERERLKGKHGGYVARDATISQDPQTIEVRLDSTNGAAVERMIVMQKGPNPRVYFIGMAGKRLDLDGPMVKRFFDSFKVFE